jgi:tRNA A37 methylthiotransferase MiaB
MPHVHISLQSGDDLILKRMKRRHLTADTSRFCDRLRSLRSDIVFGADIIAGFPTETGRTRNLARCCRWFLCGKPMGNGQRLEF